LIVFTQKIKIKNQSLQKKITSSFLEVFGFQNLVHHVEGD